MGTNERQESAAHTHYASEIGVDGVSSLFDIWGSFPQLIVDSSVVDQNIHATILVADVQLQCFNGLNGGYTQLVEVWF